MSLTWCEPLVPANLISQLVVDEVFVHGVSCIRVVHGVSSQMWMRSYCFSSWTRARHVQPITESVKLLDATWYASNTGMYLLVD